MTGEIEIEIQMRSEIEMFDRTGPGTISEVEMMMIERGVGGM